jgi:hypothetical protein
MDHEDSLHARIAALEQWTAHLHQQTRTVERRLRWWRGFACGMVILGLKSWGLQANHVVLAAQVAAMQHDIAALQAILWQMTTASPAQRASEAVVTGAPLRIVERASDGSTRTVPATDHGAVGAVLVEGNQRCDLGHAN